jgi:hypothetical protein
MANQSLSGAGVTEANLTTAIGLMSNGDWLTMDNVDITLTAAVAITNKAIRVVGRNAILRGASGAHVISITNPAAGGDLTRMTISGLTIIGHASGLDGISFRGTAGQGKYNFIEISDTTISSCRTGVYIDVPDDVVYAKFDRVWCYTMSQRGFEMDGVAMPTFIECEVSGCQLNGYSITGSIGLSMTSCASEGNNLSGSATEAEAAHFYIRRCNAFSMRSCDVEDMAGAAGPVDIAVLVSGCIGGEVLSQGVYEAATRSNQHGVRLVENSKNILISLTHNYLASPVSVGSGTQRPWAHQILGISQEVPTITDQTWFAPKRH